MKKKVELEVEIEIEPAGQENEPETPEKVVLGYSPGDEIEVGDREHTVQSINYTQGFGHEPTTFSVSTEEGLSIKGSAADVVAIIED